MSVENNLSEPGLFRNQIDLPQINANTPLLFYRDSALSLADLGGYSDAKTQFNSFNAIFSNRDNLPGYIQTLDRSVIVYGPSGIGKSAMAAAFANESNSAVALFNPSALISLPNYSKPKSSAEAVDELFSRLIAQLKAIDRKIVLIIENIDYLLVPTSTNKSLRKASRAFIDWISGEKYHSNKPELGQIFIVGTLLSSRSILPELNNNCGFYYLSLGLPDENDRVEILTKLMERKNLVSPDLFSDPKSSAHSLKSKTNLFVASDLSETIELACKEAFVTSLKDAAIKTVTDDMLLRAVELMKRIKGSKDKQPIGFSKTTTQPIKS